MFLTGVEVQGEFFKVVAFGDAVNKFPTKWRLCLNREAERRMNFDALENAVRVKLFVENRHRSIDYFYVDGHFDRAWCLACK